MTVIYNYGNNTFGVVSVEALSIGEEVKYNIIGRPFVAEAGDLPMVIEEIIEQRLSMGSFKGKRPFWQKVICTRKSLQA